MPKNESIYKLDLHEAIIIESTSESIAPTYWQCMRVAGGWIYTQWDEKEKSYTKSPTYVPFSDLFRDDDILPF